MALGILSVSVAAQTLPTLTPRQLAVNQLVNASRILAYYSIADDGPGHISVRDPSSPGDTFLITGGDSAPGQVRPADIAVVRINDSVVVGAALGGFAAPTRPAEVFIHSSIYQRFPNTTVNSIAYYRPEQLIPYSIYPAYVANATSGEASNNASSFLPTTQSVAFLGPHAAPIFNLFDSEPNATTAAVDNAVKGFALSVKFGPQGTSVSTIQDANGFRPLVLMRNDGATTAGLTVPEVVFRLMQAVKNARILSNSLATALIGGTTISSSSSAQIQFLPSTATQTSDNYLRSWLVWMSSIEAGINEDQTRNPAAWAGASGGSSSSSDPDSSSSGAASTFVSRLDLVQRVTHLTASVMVSACMLVAM
ncbi:hypothetical protein BCV70DRAFT_95051 [Testicularia cyperi]|uniref:Class II aldolase/adducin N-terminal domain-containing protein n=1 Tax=Testicularia cyperi TaxID=1882483 RepID=A0A317XST5_9BASI|nr:hypothetical protein BCV70DRAFT_95051 [Testicularia cyperi]